MVVIGPPGSGKTSLINSLLNRKCQPSYQPTKGAIIHYCKISDLYNWTETTLNYLIFALDKRVKAFSSDSDISSSESAIKNAVIYEISGDEINQVLLPLLLTPQDIVLLVYNAHLYHFSSSKYTVVLDHILQSVCFNCSAQCCKTDLNPTHSPQILMVGTHAELLSPKDVLNIANSLQQYSKGKLFEKHLSQFNPFHFVSYEAPENIQKLQDTILSSVKPVYEITVPAVYLQYEAKILSQSKSQMYLEKGEALKIAQQMEIESVGALFEFLRAIGIILYYPMLKDFIFISPSIMIKLISVVTTAKNHQSLHMERHHRSLRGLFSRLSSSDKTLAVQLFLNFGLAGYLPSDIKFGRDACLLYEKHSLLVPSLLSNIAEQLSNCVGPSVIFWFPDGFLPKYVFHQLLAKVTSWCYEGGHKFSR